MRVKFACFLVMVLFLCAIPSGAAEQKVTYINLGTAGMGGPSYILGVAWAKIVSANVPWLKATAVPGGGGYANMKRVLKGELLTATVPGDAAYSMYMGLGMYKEKIPVRAMFTYGSSKIYLCTRAESGIKKLEDLKGKKWAWGRREAAYPIPPPHYWTALGSSSTRITTPCGTVIPKWSTA